MIDKVKPGDRVQMIGILRPKINGQSYSTGGFDKYFITKAINFGYFTK